MNGERIWWKILGPLIPLAIVGILAMVAMRERVAGVERQLPNFATREVVNAQYESILRELQLIQQRLDRMGRP